MVIFYLIFLQGTIHVTEVPMEGDMKPLLDTHHGLFIGTEVLAPGVDNLVVRYHINTNCIVNLKVC